MSRIAKSVLVVLLAFALVGVLSEYVVACPNCKDALSQNDPARSGLARGFFWSIMLMLATPLLITVGLGSYFYLLVRKAKLSGQAYVPSTRTPIGDQRELAVSGSSAGRTL
ncbi:MAG: hypothetical protein RIS70_4270 [Planctomycetota bacterium]